MRINSDYKDLLRSLNAAGVRYLVVGGYAVMTHTEPRYTKDLDIWVDPEPHNADALLGALAAFGAPTKDITSADLVQPEIWYQIGVAPVRIDLITSVKGLDFARAWEKKLEADFDGEKVFVLGREAKRAAGRPQDLLDVDSLLTTPWQEGQP